MFDTQFLVGKTNSFSSKKNLQSVLNWNQKIISPLNGIQTVRNRTFKPDTPSPNAQYEAHSGPCLRSSNNALSYWNKEYFNWTILPTQKQIFLFYYK